MVNRCSWANYSDSMKKYHDKEWCAPVHDDQLLFEFLVLEGAQAGLSWNTILKKRENFRKAFDNFEYKKISRYTNQKIDELLNDKGIIRNRLKIESVITNAKALQEIQKEFGSFNTYLWNFVNHNTLVNNFKKLDDLPSKTDQSEVISKDLKKRGFKFVGPTIIYSFMQAIGMVNDHLVDCFRYNEIKKIKNPP